MRRKSFTTTILCVTVVSILLGLVQLCFLNVSSQMQRRLESVSELIKESIKDTRSEKGKIVAVVKRERSIGNVASIPSQDMAAKNIKNKATSSESFIEAAKRRALNGTIILAYFDLAALDTALNFYETSLQRLNITNFLFIVSSNKCCTALNSLDARCCVTYAIDTAENEVESVYGSVGFKRKMNVRTELILSALRAGLTVLHTDVDMYFVRNPLDYIKCSTHCDIATLMDKPTLYNAGFVYVKPTKKGIAVYSKMMLMAARFGKFSDQDQLKVVINEMKHSAGFVHLPLPTEQFLCGQLYFEYGSRAFAGDNECHTCVVIHNNFIVTLAAKVYRARETGLWDYDGNEYYSSLHRKYLLFDNPYDFGDYNTTQEEELKSLKSALAISYLLNRTLILPRFHCNSSSWCSLLSFYRLTKFEKQFSWMYREHSFLKHRKVPSALLMSRSRKYFIASARATTLFEMAELQSKDVILFEPRDPTQGARSSEIIDWFSGQSASLLMFHSLYDAFHLFEDPITQIEFNRRLKDGLQRAPYKQT